MAPDLENNYLKTWTEKPTSFFLAFQWMEKNMSELFSVLVTTLYMRYSVQYKWYFLSFEELSSWPKQGKVEHLRGSTS